MRLRDQVRALSDAIIEAADENGAREVRVFGSVARGDERPNSDVDFLVMLDPGRTLLDLARLEARLEALLGCSVDVVPETALRDSIKATALREAVRV